MINIAINNRIKVLDVELGQPLNDIAGFDAYDKIRALLRLHGTPLGYITLPLDGGRCSAEALRDEILRNHSGEILRVMTIQRLARPLEGDTWSPVDSGRNSPGVEVDPRPLVTVAVCTRNRASYLADCLDALTKLRYPSLDLLVVDNAPSDEATERLVQRDFPGVRYVCEPRPGLDWARNRAIAECRGEILAYTDDDARVDPDWVDVLVAGFTQNSDVMAVTGLVVPHALDTQAQILFERYGGFGKGFRRRWGRAGVNPRGRLLHIGSGCFGTGANMAYRREVFDRIGPFDPALDVGTVTNGGGDLEMFFRVIQEGYTLLYEPAAVIRHCHRSTLEELKTQLTNHGIGLYSHFVRSARAYPALRTRVIRFGIWWMWWWNLRRLLKSLLGKGNMPRELVFAEFRGSLVGLGRYRQARKIQSDIEARYGVMEIPLSDPRKPPVVAIDYDKRFSSMRRRYPIAVRTVDLSEPLGALDDVVDYPKVRVFAFLSGRLLGNVDIDNLFQPVSASCLRDAIADQLAYRVTGEPGEFRYDPYTEAAKTGLDSLSGGAQSTATGLSRDVSVSVIVATFDRPDHLRSCLGYLVSQATDRAAEILVVDNNPSSGLTRGVVLDFPQATLIEEPRQGSSYGRNAGILAASGEIIVTTDDDVTMPDDWLERLLVPFQRTNVGAVTGNVLPEELETEAQCLYEVYGGLGRGFEKLEADLAWFRSYKWQSVPTWNLGGTANAAFRARLLRDPRIGLMEETLGAGMPSGVGEDTYLFYKIIKSGHTLAYQPDAYVWHTHRRSRTALRRQIYNYSKGHVAYHLTTLFNDRDARALSRLFLGLPLAYLGRAKRRLRGRSVYPMSLLAVELMGNFVGPFALWRSRRRVRREGRSAPPESHGYGEHSPAG